MKTQNGLRRFVSRLIPLLLLTLLPGVLRSAGPDPGGSGISFPTNLNSWSFNDIDAWQSDRTNAPVSYTNLAGSRKGDIGGYSLVLDSTNLAWLQYNLMETNGMTNLTVKAGTVTLWFAPSWGSANTNQNGTGPGVSGRLIEVGSYTTNATYGFWSLFLSPGGTNLYFCTQTNSGDGALVTYLSAPIDWASNTWHNIALTYGSTNTALYLDGQLSATGLAVTVYPGPAVRTNGFWIGSDSNGLAQAHGLIDDVFTYDSPLDGNAITNLYDYYHGFYGINPFNAHSFLHSAPSTPSTDPVFNAVTGAGYLTSVSTNASGCVISSNVWLTNIVATTAGNGTMTVRFDIAGGSNAVAYDVFANSLLTFSPDKNTAWSWMGQGYHCSTYTLSNLPPSACFLLLGTPRDSDYDGLTDAYENLVSKSDPLNSDTDGDGIIDGWEIVWGLDPANQDSDGDGVMDQQFKVFIARPRNGSPIP